MTSRIFVSFLILSLAASGAVRAACSGGFSIYVAGQIPDVVFTSGVPSTQHFDPWYATTVSLEGSCGIYARSTTPGVSVRRSYGCQSPCALYPPGEWAAVGNAYAGSFTALSHKGDIEMVFDGTTPEGTEGLLEIGIQASDGEFAPILIASGNILVESETPPPSWFTVVSTASTVSGDSVLLDHPRLNGNGPDRDGASSVRLFVSHVWNPGGTFTGTDWNHPIGVQYDGSAEKWTIRNLDGVSMPVGLGFNVRIDPSAFLRCTRTYATSFLRAAAPGTYGNHWAAVFATPVGGPPHPVAVKYTANDWYIVYSDGALIPPDTCFNVKALSFAQYIADPANDDLSSLSNVNEDWGTGVDFGGGANHTSGASRFLYFDWASGNPQLPMVVMHNHNPLSFLTVIDPRNVGVWYYRNDLQPLPPSNHWAVFHEDRSSFGDGRFNLWSACAKGPWYTDADGDGYGAIVDGVVSCRPPAGYTAASGDCDDARASTYPGAPEVHDFYDNQCPLDAGYGVIDEVSGTAGFTVAGDKTKLCWVGQQFAQNYDVARSDKRTFAECAILGNTIATCLVDASVPLSERRYYYLVRSRGHGPSATGSWGQKSSGAERLLSCP